MFRKSLQLYCLIIILVVTIHLGCQYEYFSPSPGYIVVQLKTISNDIPISPLNNLSLNLISVNALRSDGIRIPIYQDINAFTRRPSIFSLLDSLSRDSSKILGLGYAPPAHYVGVYLELLPAGDVILDGYRAIPICTSDSCGSPYPYNQLFLFQRGFDVKEGSSTRLVLTFNVDSTLNRGAEKYYFRSEPGITYYISSVVNY